MSSVIEVGWQGGKEWKRRNLGQKLGIHHGSMSVVGSDLRVVITSEPVRATEEKERWCRVIETLG